MAAKDFVYLNGKLILRQDAKISVLDEGFLYGLALFETMRSYRGKIICLKEHLARIKNACSLVGMGFPFTFLRLRRPIEKTVQTNKLTDAYVRLTLWKEKEQTGIFIMAHEYRPYPPAKYQSGFTAIVSSLRQENTSLFYRIKSTNRILYQLSLKQAQDQGCDEALILNQQGYLSEGARSNLFMVKNKLLFTPDSKCGCLAGITRQVIIDLARACRLKVYSAKFSPQDLLEADEAFLTNSLIGVMPLTWFSKEKIGRGKCGPITRLLQQKYFCLLN